MRISKACGVAVTVLLAVIANAQSIATQFEVVSIKPNTQGGTIMIGNQRGGRFVAANVTARMLFIMAFRPMQTYQILGGPDWLNTERFDIEAKAGGVLTPQQSDAAVRAILEDRFQLRTHRETREIAVYQLVLTKGGPRLKMVKSDSEAVAASTSRSIATLPPGALSSKPGNILASAISMDQLAGALSAVVGRPVIDKTSVAGSFEVNLRYAADASARQSGTAPPAAEAEASVFTAIEEQLGLKLEGASAPVEVLVIDNVKRPAPN